MIDSKYPFVEKLKDAATEDWDTRVWRKNMKDAADAIEVMATTLEDCERWFRQYAESHEAKDDADKAKRNWDRHHACLEVLRKLRVMR